MQEFLLWIPGILFAITIHEFAHAYVANRLGDFTPKIAGRLTLNPLKHIDPIGFLMLFIIHLGWAKPVPVNPYAFRNPKSDLAMVSLAGPASNFITGAISAIILRFIKPVININNPFLNIVFLMILFVSLINFILGFFNLIPIHPLDGSKILPFFLPPELNLSYAQIAPFGPFILIGLIFFSNLSGLNIFYYIIHLPSMLLFNIFSGFYPVF